MDSWEQVQSMQRAESTRQENIPRNRSRLRLVLAFLVSIWIVELVVLWKSPETVGRVSDAIQIASDAIKTTIESPAPSTPAEVAPVEVAVGQTTSKKKPASSRRSRVPVVAAAPIVEASEEEISPAPDGVERIPQDQPAQPSQPPVDRSQANVKADSAAVYLSNSADSPVIQVLRKGDKVQTWLEVVDSKGLWSLIRDPKGSGFVRSEKLEYRPDVSTSAP